ncbi:hypothetical protein Tco_0312706 [Tanacetum coccineum]
MAYIMDTNKDERVKGVTVEVGREHFEIETTRFTIFDSPLSSRTWGEEYFGNGSKVHKYGKSTTGESWDIVVDEETYYEHCKQKGYMLIRTELLVDFCEKNQSSLIVSQSPFKNVDLGNGLFPGIGLSTLLSGARIISDGMLQAATEW